MTSSIRHQFTDTGLPVTTITLPPTGEGLEPKMFVDFLQDTVSHDQSKRPYVRGKTGHPRTPLEWESAFFVEPSNHCTVNKNFGGSLADSLKFARQISILGPCGSSDTGSVGTTTSVCKPCTAFISRSHPTDPEGTQIDVVALERFDYSLTRDPNDTCRSVATLHNAPHHLVSQANSAWGQYQVRVKRTRMPVYWSPTEELKGARSSVILDSFDVIPVDQSA